MITKQHPPVLTIAGSDSSGGAGIQADLKTMTTLGCYGMSVITALTAQNTCGVQGVLPVPADFVIRQLESVFTDIPPASIKIGMLHDRELIEALHNYLKDKSVSIILDPVMVATSGDVLLNPDALDALQTLLFPLAALVTPNVHEMSLVCGCPLADFEDLETQAGQMADKWSVPFLVKGGDLKGTEYSSDVLVLPGEEPVWYESPRINTPNSHGTGCTLSSAIASFTAHGLSLKKAVNESKQYIRSALESGRNQSWGQGRGPVNHMWNNTNQFSGVYR
ncbi:MAG: bifunctional hydroxymethylpyrimidine kinase/phosphomethylpyrimidine kinase [Spirochaetales bacterium]|nr:bifunctional hydroxymethylpyrimidine kinase/phosphomethylpyrimidine kinase [Spirochaetales bacterium]